jgi:hypothetical protein
MVVGWMDHGHAIHVLARLEESDREKMSVLGPAVGTRRDGPDKGGSPGIYRLDFVLREKEEEIWLNKTI